MRKLQKRFNDKLNNNRINKEYIQHYLRRHGSVPLWVLVNDLTFGNISNFYQLMKRGDQDRVCNFLNKDKSVAHYVNPRLLLRIFDVLVYFRNLCAHDERLYCARKGNKDFGQMLGYLKIFIDNESFVSFLREIEKLISVYCPKIEWISKDNMIEILGIHEYIEDLNNMGAGLG